MPFPHNWKEKGEGRRAKGERGEGRGKKYVIPQQQADSKRGRGVKYIETVNEREREGIRNGNSHERKKNISA